MTEDNGHIEDPRRGAAAALLMQLVHVRLDEAVTRLLDEFDRAALSAPDTRAPAPSVRPRDLPRAGERYHALAVGRERVRPRDRDAQGHDAERRGGRPHRRGRPVALFQVRAVLMTGLCLHCLATFKSTEGLTAHGAIARMPAPPPSAEVLAAWHHYLENDNAAALALGAPGPFDIFRAGYYFATAAHAKKGAAPP